ncbi:unnamed protein product [Darwinula stevensoni]|uniref:Protein transport protein Sec61 subunit beta n=1 Tax=Darwinula stevensoni TaxID=69355 RepID=A0A7R8X5F0_9CRUS|nr:unnamed protein product [Darwinula stevensoni]CAG0884707.1 unnamed protein product [Darwinula stevensoni]
MSHVPKQQQLELEQQRRRLRQEEEEEAEEEEEEEEEAPLLLLVFFLLQFRRIRPLIEAPPPRPAPPPGTAGRVPLAVSLLHRFSIRRGWLWLFGASHGSSLLPSHRRITEECQMKHDADNESALQTSPGLSDLLPVTGTTHFAICIAQTRVEGKVWNAKDINQGSCIILEFVTQTKDVPLDQSFGILLLSAVSTYRAKKHSGVINDYHMTLTKEMRLSKILGAESLHLDLGSTREKGHRSGERHILLTLLDTLPNEEKEIGRLLKKDVVVPLICAVAIVVLPKDPDSGRPEMHFKLLHEFPTDNGYPQSIGFSHLKLILPDWDLYMRLGTELLAGTGIADRNGEGLLQTGKQRSVPVVDAIETEFGAHVTDRDTREGKQGLHVTKRHNKCMQTMAHIVRGVQLGKHKSIGTRLYLEVGGAAGKLLVPLGALALQGRDEELPGEELASQQGPVVQPHRHDVPNDQLGTSVSLVFGEEVVLTYPLQAAECPRPHLLQALLILRTGKHWVPLHCLPHFSLRSTPWLLHHKYTTMQEPPMSLYCNHVPLSHCGGSVLGGQYSPEGTAEEYPSPTPRVLERVHCEGIVILGELNASHGLDPVHLILSCLQHVMAGVHLLSEIRPAAHGKGACHHSCFRGSRHSCQILGRCLWSKLPRLTWTFCKTTTDYEYGFKNFVKSIEFAHLHISAIKQPTSYPGCENVCGDDPVSDRQVSSSGPGWSCDDDRDPSALDFYPGSGVCLNPHRSSSRVAAPGDDRRHVLDCCDRGLGRASSHPPVRKGAPVSGEGDTPQQQSDIFPRGKPMAVGSQASLNPRMPGDLLSIQAITSLHLDDSILHIPHIINYLLEVQVNKTNTDCDAKVPVGLLGADATSLSEIPHSNGLVIAGTEQVLPARVAHQAPHPVVMPSQPPTPNHCITSHLVEEEPKSTCNKYLRENRFFPHLDGLVTRTRQEEGAGPPPGSPIPSLGLPGSLIDALQNPSRDENVGIPAECQNHRKYLGHGCTMTGEAELLGRSRDPLVGGSLVPWGSTHPQFVAKEEALEMQACTSTFFDIRRMAVQRFSRRPENLPSVSPGSAASRLNISNVSMYPLFARSGLQDQLQLLDMYKGLMEGRKQNEIHSITQLAGTSRSTATTSSLGDVETLVAPWKHRVACGSGEATACACACTGQAQLHHARFGWIKPNFERCSEVTVHGNVTFLLNLMPVPSSSTTVGAGGRGTTKSIGSRPSSGAVRQRKTTSSASASRARATPAGGSGGMWRFYTDDSPGIKVGPVPVLVMSLLFIASVFMLHIWGKYTQVSRKHLGSIIKTRCIGGSGLLEREGWKFILHRCVEIIAGATCTNLMGLPFEQTQERDPMHGMLSLCVLCGFCILVARMDPKN